MLNFSLAVLSFYLHLRCHYVQGLLNWIFSFHSCFDFLEFRILARTFFVENVGDSAIHVRVFIKNKERWVYCIFKQFRSCFAFVSYPEFVDNTTFRANFHLLQVLYSSWIIGIIFTIQSSAGLRCSVELALWLIFKGLQQCFRTWGSLTLVPLGSCSKLGKSEN
jgi:hypothetical protein